MAMNNGFDREVRFEITEHIGIIATYSTGWNKELNLVSWNGGQPKYDIRDWDMGHEHMSRGVTLHEKEMRQIFDLMKKRRMDSRRMENRLRRDGTERAAPEGAAFESTASEGVVPERVVSEGREDNDDFGEPVMEPVQEPAI